MGREVLVAVFVSVSQDLLILKAIVPGREKRNGETKICTLVHSSSNVHNDPCIAKSKVDIRIATVSPSWMPGIQVVCP